jgi:hypothetical protein
MRTVTPDPGPSSLMSVCAGRFPGAQGGHVMSRSFALVMVGMAMAVEGCVTPAQFLDSKRSMAVKTAVTRGSSS